MTSPSMSGSFLPLILLSCLLYYRRARELSRSSAHVAASDGAVQGRLITGKRRADNRENLLNFGTRTETKRHNGYARPQRRSAVPVRPETALRRRRQGCAPASTGTGFQNRPVWHNELSLAWGRHRS